MYSVAENTKDSHNNTVSLRQQASIVVTVSKISLSQETLEDCDVMIFYTSIQLASSLTLNEHTSQGNPEYRGRNYRRYTKVCRW